MLGCPAVGQREGARREAEADRRDQVDALARARQRAALERQRLARVELPPTSTAARWSASSRPSNGSKSGAALAALEALAIAALALAALAGAPAAPRSAAPASLGEAPASLGGGVPCNARSSR